MQNLYKIMVILSYVCMYIKIFVEDKTTADIWKLDFTIDKPNNRYSSSMEIALVKKMTSVSTRKRIDKIGSLDIRITKISRKGKCCHLICQSDLLQG